MEDKVCVQVCKGFFPCKGPIYAVWLVGTRPMGSGTAEMLELFDMAFRVLYEASPWLHSLSNRKSLMDGAIGDGKTIEWLTEPAKVASLLIAAWPRNLHAVDRLSLRMTGDVDAFENPLVITTHKDNWQCDLPRMKETYAINFTSTMWRAKH